MKFLLNTTITYRVNTVGEALALRETLSKNPFCELISFSYTTKYIKEHGEIVEEYQVVKAKLEINKEKEPESYIDFYLTDNSDASMEDNNDF